MEQPTRSAITWVLDATGVKLHGSDQRPRLLIENHVEDFVNLVPWAEAETCFAVWTLFGEQLVVKLRRVNA